MLFNSFQFLIFFVIVVGLYFVLPSKFRWFLLLVCSYYFYMAWKPEYIILIIISTIIDYFASLAIGQTISKKKKKLLLSISLCTNLGILFYFKYMLFFSQSLSGILSVFNMSYSGLDSFEILLPMGISFYTFQTMSYTIDVYRGKIKPEKHFGVFALYVSFFPQLVAGPIERSERLIPQFYKKHKFDINRIVSGLKLMLIGFFKKVVIADRVAVVVNTIYNQPNEYEGLYFVIATFLFAFQIFCDFSGYSDIAIGVAKVLGIDLMTNFKRPYFAKSIREFWRRWHISLSTWFRDYLYIPLGGSRVRIPRFFFNVFITFLISGLWHGASWTFVIWGAIHGIYQIVGYITRPVKVRLINFVKLNRVPRILGFFQIVITFILVCFGWVFFRANNLNDALFIIKNLFNQSEQWTDLNYVYEVIINMGVNLIEMLSIALSILILIMIQWLSRKESIHERLLKVNFIVRWSFYYIILIYVLTMGVFYNANEFIYFQF
ncbi:MAG: MBOAT family O-acyltransferase [Eubacteriales bacterium]